MVAQLQRQIDRSHSRIEKTALRKYARSLSKQIERTYRGSGYSQQQALNVLKSQAGSTKGMSAKQRSNKIFQQQIGLASRGAQSSIGQLGKEKTKIFYAATQNIWQGLPPAKRNKAIMAALGTDSMAEAYDKVMKKQSQAINAAKGLYKPIGVTDENAGFYNDMSGEDVEISPKYLDFITVIR